MPLAGRARNWPLDQALARTIKRYEALDGIPPSRTSSLVDIKAALESAGIEFIGTPEDRPGIRVELRKLDSK